MTGTRAAKNRTPPTDLDLTMRGWERKARAIERAQSWFERGRLCAARQCFTGATFAVRLPRLRREVPLCRAHLEELQRTRRITAVRRFDAGEVLNGPAVDDE